MKQCAISRNISEGLVLPHIESADLPEILQRVVAAHEYRTGTSVGLSMSDSRVELAPSAKICIYRFVQEALNNAFRHGGSINQRVMQTWQGNRVVVEVADSGPGFRPGACGPFWHWACGTKRPDRKSWRAFHTGNVATWNSTAHVTQYKFNGAGLMTVRVAVIDDHPLFREGVKQSLGEFNGFQIVGEGCTKDDAIRIAQEQRPDVILMDISLPGGGLNAISPISIFCPSRRS